MTVKDLISKLLEMPMDAEVFISDPTPFEDGHGRCNGYYFGIDDVNQNSDVVELRFTDWRVNKAESEEVCQEKKQ